MMNLIMMNLNEIKTQKGSSLNYSSKISNLDKKSEFENVMIKNKPMFNKDLSKNNFNLNTILPKKIEINIQDKEELVQDLEEKLDADYTKEDLVNIINFYLAINLMNNNENNLKIDSLEFTDVTEELISQESSLEDLIGVLKLNNEILSIPVISNTLEHLNKIDSLAITSKIEDVNKEVNFKEYINANNEIDFVGEEKDIIEMSKQFDYLDFSSVENLIKNNEDMFKVSASDCIEIFKQIEVILSSSQKENNKSLDVYTVLDDKDINILDIFNKKINTAKSIDEKFNVENAEIKYVDKSNTQTIEDINKFSNFLINQRSSNIKLEASKTNDKDMDILMEIVDSESKVDVNNIINLDTSSFKSNINDTMKTSIIPESIRQSFVEVDITQTIQHMNSNGINELTLKVKPKELGEVVINLIKNKNVSDVLIIVEKEELFTSIKKNLGIINKELKDLGLKINDISIQIKPNNVTNTSFNFMSNPNEDNSKNQNSNYNQDKKLKKSIKSTNDVDILESEISKNEVENEINLLA